LQVCDGTVQGTQARGSSTFGSLNRLHALIIGRAGDRGALRLRVGGAFWGPSPRS
jgi:hypothetical protein